MRTETVTRRVPAIDNKTDSWWMRTERNQIVIFDFKPEIDEDNQYAINNRDVDQYGVYWDSIQHIRDIYIIPQATRESVIVLDPSKLITDSVRLFSCWGPTTKVAVVESWKDDVL